MNKNIFLVDLSKCLGFMTETEREEALRYYAELFDEAGPENERKVLAQLGSPTKVAVELHRSYDRSHADTTGAEVLMRGNFAAAKPEASEEAAPVEEVPVTEMLPKIETILKGITSADEPEQPETEAADVAEAEAPVCEEPAPVETQPEAEDKPEGEPVFVEVPVPAREQRKAEEKNAAEDEPLEKKRGMPGWAIALILVLTCEIWLPIFAALLCVAICIAVVPFALGLSFVAIAAYLVICAIWALGVITDALLMLAGAAIALAIGLVLTWLGIWAAIKLIVLLCRGTAASYRGIFGRPKKERAK